MNKSLSLQRSKLPIADTTESLVPLSDMRRIHFTPESQPSIAVSRLC